MKKLNLFILLLVLVALWGVLSFNNLVRANKAVDNQWAQVENQYQRRLSLIPNLVNTVKGGSKQELAFAKEVTDARTAFAAASTVDAKASAASNLETSLGRLIAVIEANPAISTVPLYQDLSAELAGTENRVAVERGRYNDNVTQINIAVRTFPSNIIAKTFGFKERTLFKAEAGAEKTPEVNF
ncbi:MAG: LemA family protein [Patescibacteria group bacterium]